LDINPEFMETAAQKQFCKDAQKYSLKHFGFTKHE